MRRCLLVSLVFVLASCSEYLPEEPLVNKDADLTGATSWRQIPALLEVALEEKIAALYDSLLAGDFVYHFATSDVSRGLTPSSWNKAREMQSVKGLFGDPAVGEISVDWVPGELTESPVEGSDGRVVLSELRMLVPKTDAADRRTAFTVSGVFVLDLKKMPWRDAAGRPVWKILAWWENPADD